MSGYAATRSFEYAVPPPSGAEWHETVVSGISFVERSNTGYFYRDLLYKTWASGTLVTNARICLVGETNRNTRSEQPVSAVDNTQMAVRSSWPMNGHAAMWTEKAYDTILHATCFRQ